jgi:hypothetical protein
MTAFGWRFFYMARLPQELQRGMVVPRGGRLEREKAEFSRVTFRYRSGLA